MEWTMVYLFVALKVPIVAAGWIVWWAVKAEPELADEQPDDEGGTRRRPHPVPLLPRSPRRGPHGDPLPLPPARVRPVSARARDPQR